MVSKGWTYTDLTGAKFYPFRGGSYFLFIVFG